MTNHTFALAPAPRQTIAAWHGAFVSRDRDRLLPLLADDVVMRSPVVQSPIAGRVATTLVLTTVAAIFEGFRYHRTYIAGPCDAALEFSASIGKWELKGVDLMRLSPTGQIVEFEVMVRPLRAASMLAEEMGRRIGPQLLHMKQCGTSD
jgi:hypothetical protein